MHRKDSTMIQPLFVLFLICFTMCHTPRFNIQPIPPTFCMYFFFYSNTALNASRLLIGDQREGFFCKKVQHVGTAARRAVSVQRRVTVITTFSFLVVGRTPSPCCCTARRFVCHRSFSFSLLPHRENGAKKIEREYYETNVIKSTVIDSALFCRKLVKSGLQFAVLIPLLKNQSEAQTAQT